MRTDNKYLGYSFFNLINQNNIPVHPMDTIATANKLTAYEVAVPKASHQISHTTTNINVTKDTMYPKKKKKII